jgi:hypothetical protein
MGNADTRWVESKASATDRVIELIIPTGSGAVAVMAGETVCETDCLSVLGDDPSAEGLLWTVTVSEQTGIIIRVTKDKRVSTTWAQSSSSMAALEAS